MVLEMTFYESVIFQIFKKMKSISIFISSPGDVGKERHTASRVIERLQHEFADRAALEPYFWEYEPMQATKDFQENIPSTAHFDILVCILWSRLGTRLGAKYSRSDVYAGSYTTAAPGIHSYHQHHCPKRTGLCDRHPAQ